MRLTQEGLIWRDVSPNVTGAQIKVFEVNGFEDIHKYLKDCKEIREYTTFGTDKKQVRDALHKIMSIVRATYPGQVQAPVQALALRPQKLALRVR